jgi:hypothetical protein
MAIKINLNSNSDSFETVVTGVEEISSKDICIKVENSQEYFNQGNFPKDMVYSMIGKYNLSLNEFIGKKVTANYNPKSKELESIIF